MVTIRNEMTHAHYADRCWNPSIVLLCAFVLLFFYCLRLSGVNFFSVVTHKKRALSTQYIDKKLLFFVCLSNVTFVKIIHIAYEQIAVIRHKEHTQPNVYRFSFICAVVVVIVVVAFVWRYDFSNFSACSTLSRDCFVFTA